MGQEGTFPGSRQSTNGPYAVTPFQTTFLGLPYHLYQDLLSGLFISASKTNIFYAFFIFPKLQNLKSMRENVSVCSGNTSWVSFE
jgi:hypothetical protein